MEASHWLVRPRHRPRHGPRHGQRLATGIVLLRVVEPSRDGLAKLLLVLQRVVEVQELVLQRVLEASPRVVLVLLAAPPQIFWFCNGW